MTLARVHCIFIAPSKGKPMQDIERVLAVEGAGLSGDRYEINKGAWSTSARQIPRHATLITLEAIVAANAELKVPFLLSETRRNIVIQDISPEELNELVGKEFMVGRALVRGVERCDPCSRPSKLCGKPGFEKAFQDQGGIRIEILHTGFIEIGDRLAYPVAVAYALLPD